MKEMDVGLFKIKAPWIAFLKLRVQCIYTLVQFLRKMAKLGQKCTKFENILKNGRYLHATIAHNKLLEKALR